MRARKQFCVIAYDIMDDKRRGQVVKILEKAGKRINYSVFECMLAPAEMKKIREKIGGLIFAKEDQIVYYPVCMNCFTKIVYQPAKEAANVVNIV